MVVVTVSSFAGRAAHSRRCRTYVLSSCCAIGLQYYDASSSDLLLQYILTQVYVAKPPPFAAAPPAVHFFKTVPRNKNDRCGACFFFLQCKNTKKTGADRGAPPSRQGQERGAAVPGVATREKAPRKQGVRERAAAKGEGGAAAAERRPPALPRQGGGQDRQPHALAVAHAAFVCACFC